MLEQLKKLQKSEADFAFETTLASRNYAPWLRECLRDGYDIVLLFLALPSPDMALARVPERVRIGGHDIPEATVERRFRRGLTNFFDMDRKLAGHWFLVDNSTLSGSRLIAEGHGEAQARIVWPERYRLLETYRET